MAVDKLVGQDFRSTIAFYHYGEGGEFDVGIGLKYTPSPTWAAKRITISNNSSNFWKVYRVEVSGTFMTDLQDGRTVDVLKFIQVAGGQLDIGGNDFVIADWDRDVYKVVR